MKIPMWVGVVVAVGIAYVVLSSQRMGTTCAMKEKFEGQSKEMTSCPGGYRSDGPCLMEFPGF